MSVYVSTTCSVNKNNVFDVLEAYSKAGLKNVELGFTLNYNNDLSPVSLARYDFNFIVHHYFPPPQEPFIINLASQDALVLERSKEQIKKSIDFCNASDIKLFTFHAGFRADPDSKLVFPRSKAAASYEVAFNTFVESIDEIDSYARNKGVRIAVENNVLARYNMAGEQNPFLLMCEASEFEKLFDRIPSTNLGILLDLGHLRVTSYSLGFDKYEFIDKVSNRVFAIHVHENNGQMDEHKELDKNSWCLEIIRKKCFTNLPVVIESVGIPIDRVIRQVRLIEQII